METPLQTPPSNSFPASGESPALCTAGNGLVAGSLCQAIAWGTVVIALILVALPFDQALTSWVCQVAPAGTIQHRVLKLAYNPFRWWTFVAFGAVLLARASWRQWFIGFLVTVLTTVGVLHLVKYVVGRARPELSVGAYAFHPFGDPRLGFDAFPSGHATMAFLLVALLGMYARWTRWLLAPVAVLACLARIAQERHFVSDVVGGAGLALLTVWLTRRHLGSRYFPPGGTSGGAARRSGPMINSVCIRPLE
ncbi:MAG TPA: phosphatase PAP2 family protein [Phycisphaerae bacterium]|nr:phosphatase PAP2 family protein [Phycisphaerae bacterium]HNU46363.1 phosphatase PAP2 family protein [Phycisphaerae bacterium]